MTFLCLSFIVKQLLGQRFWTKTLTLGQHCGPLLFVFHCSVDRELSQLGRGLPKCAYECGTVKRGEAWCQSAFWLSGFQKLGPVFHVLFCRQRESSASTCKALHDSRPSSAEQLLWFSTGFAALPTSAAAAGDQFLSPAESSRGHVSALPQPPIPGCVSTRWQQCCTSTCVSMVAILPLPASASIWIQYGRQWEFTSQRTSSFAQSWDSLGGNAPNVCQSEQQQSSQGTDSQQQYRKLTHACETTLSFTRPLRLRPDANPHVTPTWLGPSSQSDQFPVHTLRLFYVSICVLALGVSTSTLLHFLLNTILSRKWQVFECVLLSCPQNAMTVYLSRASTATNHKYFFPIVKQISTLKSLSLIFRYSQEEFSNWQLSRNELVSLLKRCILDIRKGTRQCSCTGAFHMCSHIIILNMDLWLPSA